MSELQTKIAGLVPYELIKKMHENFLKDKHHLLSTHIGKHESKSMWLEMNDDLRIFLTDLLNPHNKVSGIRFYFCNYETDTVPPGKPNYVNMMTIGLVATEKIGTLHPDHTMAREYDKLVVPPVNHGTLCPPDDCP